MIIYLIPINIINQRNKKHLYLAKYKYHVRLLINHPIKNTLIVPVESIETAIRAVTLIPTLSTQKTATPFNAATKTILQLQLLQLQ